MANSQFEYVKRFEQQVVLLPDTYIIVRVDGRGFHKLSAKYEFDKPNDRNVLDLMNATAISVMKEIPDVMMAYGVSDEYSFIFDKSCTLFDRRESKILTTIVSTFTSYFVQLWPAHLPHHQLSSPMPSFDGRVVLYPSIQTLRDYLSWRQVDCHVNNLYNTTFWALIVKEKLSNKEAERRLKGTRKSEKNEIMFKLGINYNNEPEIYRKGSILYRDCSVDLDGRPFQPMMDITKGNLSKIQSEEFRRRGPKARVALEHIDIIQNDFWDKRPYLLVDSDAINRSKV